MTAGAWLAGWLPRAQADTPFPHSCSFRCSHTSQTGPFSAECRLSLGRVLCSLFPPPPPTQPSMDCSCPAVLILTWDTYGCTGNVPCCTVIAFCQAVR
ncbi:hypothetical protein BO71DRAFT_399515 [Aspergillus ellipticus CBS 707.79]|uniref:Uncharacterized protein n=1 Tax=Aspergillus ellipticus CBS 707.79 TaxID=1448320 RepID=A0A319D8S5_9EURO|nr:hypothetical protein BO71DRAFT_399515 [Aspergillus ellipticus CBS 707.79]